MKKYILTSFVFLFLFSFNVDSTSAAMCAPGDLFNSNTGQACGTTSTTTQNNTNTQVARGTSGLVIEITAKTINNDYYVDATPSIREGISRLKTAGGGTLFFGPGKYLVKDTIEIPSNITIQGVGSGEVGPTMIVLGVQKNMVGFGKALFSIIPGAKNVIIRDVELRSMTPGWNVYPRYDISRINSEETTGIRMKATSSLSISDIQFENVRIVNFTYGIDALGGTIKNITMRSISSNVNSLALRVNSLNATNWDVQNLNAVEMGNNQKGVLLERAGKMAFLQLSCASTLGNADLCVEIKERSGPLYFRQLHIEGPREYVRVKSSSTHPIYFENSAMGAIVEAENTIYSFSNRYQLDPQEGLRFTGAGARSKVYACGDVFTLGYPVQTQTGQPYHGLNNQPENCNFDITKVKNAFATGTSPFKIFNWVTSSFSSSPNFLNVKSFGAKGDGVTDDTEAFRRALKDIDPSVWSLSTLVVPPGRYKITNTLVLDDGTTVRGEAGAIIEFRATNRPLFQIRAMQSDPINKRAIGVNGLSLRSMTPNPQNQNTAAIEFSGTRGATGDYSFSNLDIAGFTRGLHIKNDSGVLDNDQPQFDSIAVRNLVLTDNHIAIEFKDQNASNWNFENINIPSMKSGQKGVVIDGGGHIAFRGLRCEGQSSSNSLQAESCFMLGMHGGIYIENLTAKNVKHALYVSWKTGWAPFPVLIRDSDLRDGVYVAGKMYLVSVSNLFTNPSSNSQTTPRGSRSIYFNTYGADDTQNIYPGDESRVSSCGDSFSGNTSELAFVGLKQAAKKCLSSTVVPPSVLNITTSSILPTASVGASYSTAISATGGAGSYSWSLKSGLLPAGMSFTPAVCVASPCQAPVTISGTPIKVGSYNFTVEVRSSTSSSAQGSKLSAVKEFTLKTEKQSTTNNTNNNSNDGAKVLGAESFKFTQKLQKGSTGNEVVELQKFLNLNGYDCGTPDGNFGPKTEIAVKKFQTANGLNSDGIVGPLVRAIFNK